MSELLPDFEPRRNKIRFSRNYPKLNCPVFTTLRLFTKEKYDYYMGELFSDFEVTSPGKKYPGTLFNAQLIAAETIKICEISDELSTFDACCTPKEIYNLFSMYYSRKPEWEKTSTEMILLVFLRTSPVN